MNPLRDTNFRLLFAGRAISYVGTYLAPIAVVAAAWVIASTLFVVRLRCVCDYLAEPRMEAAAEPVTS